MLENKSFIDKHRKNSKSLTFTSHQANVVLENLCIYKKEYLGLLRVV